LIWCSLLNPALDVLYKVNDFKSGTTYVDTACSQVPAGKGLNVARVIHALGEEVSVTGLLPEYENKRFTGMLDSIGILHRFFPVPGPMRINTTILDEVSGSSTHISAVTPEVSTRLQHEYTDFAGQLMHPGDHWCFSGSLPKGFSDDSYASLIGLCSDAGGLSLLDSRATPFQKGLRARPTMVKPNLSELEEFFGEQIRGVHHIALKGKRLLDMGITYIFISLGADGMIALHKNDCILCSAPGVTVRDTVGCGDALVAGVLVALKRQFSFTETCRMAVACGSAKAQCYGPGAIDSEAVWQLMEEIQITSV
jgi:tagatose 6-phosphate kinase